MDYGVITFTSTYGAIYAQKVLRPVADVLTMPVLREISLGCGIAVRFRPEDGAAVRAALAASTLRPDEYAFYGVTGSGAALRAAPLHGYGPPGAHKTPPTSRDSLPMMMLLNTRALPISTAMGVAGRT